jgi:hypothetical protein
MLIDYRVLKQIVLQAWAADENTSIHFAAKVGNEAQNHSKFVS